MSTNLLTASLVGISLWATIEPPKPIVKLNVKNERPLLALKLAVNYSQGIYTVGLEMPETFSVSVPLPFSTLSSNTDIFPRSTHRRSIPDMTLRNSLLVRRSPQISS